MFVTCAPPGGHRNGTLGKRAVQCPPPIVNLFVPVPESLFAKVFVLSSHMMAVAVMESGKHHGFDLRTITPLNGSAQSFEVGRPCSIGKSTPLEERVSLSLPVGKNRRTKKNEKQNEDSSAVHVSDKKQSNGGVDAAARIQSSIAGRIKLRNTPPPLASNDLLGGVALTSEYEQRPSNNFHENDAAPQV